MRLAISGTELDTDEPIGALLESAGKLKIGFIELWHPRNTSTEGLDKTIDRVLAAGVEIACVSAGSELYRDGGSREDQELLLESIQLAARVGARFVNTYFGHHPVRDDERAIETYQRLLAPCLDLAQSAGVAIVLENEFNAFGEDPAQSDITRRPAALRQLVEGVGNPHFRLNFDPCNFYCAGVEPYPYAYEILAPFIAYCHVKDGEYLNNVLASTSPVSGWRRFRDYDNEFVMRPLGQGAIPWKALMKSLRSDAYPGFLTLEPHAETAHRELAWQQAAEYMQRIL